MISEIYKTASNILVRLGTGSAEATEGLEFLSNLAKRSEQFGIKDDWLLAHSFKQTTETEQLLKDAIRAHVHSVYQLP